MNSRFFQQPAKIFVVLFVGATLIACESARSQAVDPADVLTGEDHLQNFLDEARTVQAEFYQELWSADDQLVEIATGSLSLQRPNQFLWRYREPIEQLVLADGVSLWIYDVELAQVTVTPLNDIIEATPAMLLSGDQSVRDRFETLEWPATLGYDHEQMAARAAALKDRAKSGRRSATDVAEMVAGFAR